MINLDAMTPMQQDPSEMFAVDSDYEYNNDSEDYDDDFIDALMTLDDGPVDEAPNSDSFPVNEATFPGIDMMHVEGHFMNLQLDDGQVDDASISESFPVNEATIPGPDMVHVEGRYLVLESQDIVCGGMHQMIHHPGNALLERIVADFILPYGLATKDPERQTLLGEILSQIEMACYSAGWRPPRYVFPAVTSDGLAYYQAASRHAITEEIKCSIKSHFNIIPTPSDVLFGRGQPCRDFPGNIRFRTYIDNQSRRYTSARPNDRRRMIQLTRESVTAVGGRFLLPFDKARPSDGCVEAPDDAIRRKIAHLYRDNPNPRQEGVEMVQAHPVDEVLPAPMFYHWGPDAPSVSSSTKDAETTQTTEASAKILDGESITPSSDQSTGTTASSRPSFGGLILDLKTFFFKWPKILLCLTGIVIAIVVGISLATISGKEEVGLTTLQVIQRRGRLICGVTNQIGYSTQDISTKLWMGFEVDICRAQAAAIFGKDRFYPLSPRASEPVEYVDLLPSERFHALKNKTVDILLAVTSQTMERTVYESSTMCGYTHSTPYLVNEVALAGRDSDLECLEYVISNTTDFGSCDNLKICILGASTHQDIVLAQDFDPANIVTASDIDDFYKSFLNDDCNILLGEKFDLAKQHLSARGYTGSYKVGFEVLAKEYISLVTRDDDAEFSDFCNWIIQSLFSAEEEFQMDETDGFGDLYRHMFQDAVGVVGDYGKLYNLYLEEIVPRSATNHINNGSSANMFALPVGNTLLAEPPSSTESHTIKEILTRGTLSCGITDTPFFAELNKDNDWVGLDIDFCNGIAAGLFAGEFKDQVIFVQLNPDARFDALLSGKVDVLARATTITFDRDVKKKIDGVGLAYSFPNFFDSIKFAGSRELVRCAENRDSTSRQCSTLHICVTSNTTQSELVARLFPHVPKTLSESTSRNVDSLKSGPCNVLVGGSADIFQLRSPGWFEEKNYVVGTKHLSRESLALVTRDNDPLWSKFVNWVVLATIHAEENNITQETYSEMPLVNLFGPSVEDEMLRDVIRAGGSYREIWQRRAIFGNFLEREGRNLLAASSNDTSPLLRSDLFWDET